MRCSSMIKKVANVRTRQCAVYTYALSGLCCYHTRNYLGPRETEQKRINNQLIRVDYQNRSLEKEMFMDYSIVLCSEM